MTDHETPDRVRGAVILDGRTIKRWQRDCLENSRDLMDVAVVYSCRSPVPGKRRLKHAAYYLLNLVSLRNVMTRRTAFDGGRAEVVEFDAPVDGAWQSLPPAVIDDARARGVDCFVKFGMGLLRIPPELSGIGVLSFHHGDPEAYRGRPAGFYEILHRAPSQGVVVQILTNKLDAGTFLARGRFRIDHHSYRRTAERFYAGSRHVFRAALLALRAGRTLAVDGLGPNYRLPSNGTVAIFAAKTLYWKVAHLLRGMFLENGWRIAVQPTAGDAATVCLSLEHAETADTPAGYRFFADPFFSIDGATIFAEGLSERSHVGDIVAIDAERLAGAEVVLSGGHHSYPSVLSIAGESFLLPETATHGPPALRSISSDEVRPLLGLEDHRLIDPTHFEHEGHHYLFAGLPGEAADTLYLFHGPKADGPYSAHRASPIVLDPQCARMGGNILCLDDGLYRLGQDNRFGYDSSLRAMRIRDLSPLAYVEEHGFDIALAGAKGPHTLNVGRRGYLFDYYREHFSLLAGYRRLRARLA